MKKLFITTLLLSISFVTVEAFGKTKSIDIEIIKESKSKTINSELTLEQKAAKLLIIGFKGTTFEDSGALKENLDKGVSGVILFEHNITPADKGKNSMTILQKLNSDIQAYRDENLFIAVDQEGGLVNRLKAKYGFLDMLSQQKVGERDDLEFTAYMGGIIASQVKKAGFNLNFSPDVDVNINPLCPVIGKIGRSFSADEDVVCKNSEIYIDKHHNAGILTSLKHFPGHGSSKTDSHNGFTDITDSWEERELTPYKYLIEKNKCDMVMISHLFNQKFDEKYPATLSKKTISGVLRGDLGWNGVVISDDMQMKAITDNYGFEESIQLGVIAGIDLFIVSSFTIGDGKDMASRAIKAIVDGVKSGKINEAQIDQSIARIEALRKRLR